MAPATEETVYSSQSTLPVCLWQENPNRLVSLWDLMQIFRAHDLLKSVREVNNLASLIFDLNEDPDYKPHMITLYRESIDKCRVICADLDLQMSALHAQQLFESTDFQDGTMFDQNQAGRIATMLSITIENELSLRSFFALTQDKKKYFKATHPLSEDICTAFPSCRFDATEASNSYALGRNTACVFHLMRVLEIGLGVLASEFSIPSDHANWETIINQIEKAIADIDKSATRPADWKNKREFYSQSASYFRILKDAWRNYTAHVRAKYDDEEALDILGNVRGFMKKLAERLSENP